MKKLILSILLVLFFASECFGALAATTVWEVQQDATGGSLNGGGFNSSNASKGTDRSQTTAAYKDHNDLVIGSAGNEANVTSVAHPFTADDNGNLIHITAGTGFTAGWYEVVSVNGSNVATLDRAVGTADSTAGTYYLGGALSFNSTLDQDVMSALVAGNTMYFKYNASAIAIGESINISTNGTSTAVINLIGYNSDRAVAPTGATRPTIAVGTNAFAVGTYVKIQNIIFTLTSANGIVGGDYTVFENCKSTNSSGTASRKAFTIDTGGKIINSEAISTNGAALYHNDVSGLSYGNYAHDSATCVQSNGNGQTIINNILANCSTTGIYLGSSSYHTVVGNTLIGNAVTPAGTGILNTTGHANFVYNNIIAHFATGSAADNLYLNSVRDYNNYYNNTTADRTNIVTGSHDVDLDPGFPGGTDYSVGVNMKAAGFPGAFSGSSSTGYLDIGAVQRVEPTAGGGGAWGF
jgi:hypothetical protein